MIDYTFLLLLLLVIKVVPFNKKSMTICACVYECFLFMLVWCPLASKEAVILTRKILELCYFQPRSDLT